MANSFMSTSRYCLYLVQTHGENTLVIIHINLALCSKVDVLKSYNFFDDTLVHAASYDTATI